MGSLKISGLKILIDKIDRDLIRDYRWHRNGGRLQTSINGKTHYLHRMIAERMGLNPDKWVFRKNGNHLDFRRSNLIDISPKQKSIRENALIDEWNIDFLGKYSWCLNSDGYLIAWVNGKMQSLHRLIAKRMGLDPSKQVDHIDRNLLNNYESNLREATHSQNGMNSEIQSNNTSGVTGVCWDKRTQKWLARISVNGKRIHLDYFKHKKDEIKVRKEAELKYFGEFANEG